MSKKRITNKDSRDIKAEASKLVRSLNISGDTKEQTRQIIQGVQRAMEIYMRQQSEKTRDLDKRTKKVSKLQVSLEQESLAEPEENIVYKQSKLPWVLFLLSSTALLVNVTLSSQLFSL